MQTTRAKIKIIALTGGIGSGKSVAAEYFAALGVPVIDADQIAHNLTSPKTLVFKKIIAHFGNELKTHDGLLNRKKLRYLIFHNPKEREWLEKLLHPAIYRKMTQESKKYDYPYCIFVIPLLFEAKIKPKKIDRILVVDCPKKMQFLRAAKRDKTTQKNIAAIIKAQIERKTRIKQADDLITNNSSPKSLQQKIAKLHAHYLKTL